MSWRMTINCTIPSVGSPDQHVPRNIRKGTKYQTRQSWNTGLTERRIPFRLVKLTINLMMSRFPSYHIKQWMRHMTLKNDTHVNVTISSNHCPMIYYLIDDGDYESIRFCQNNGCAIKTITFYGKPYYFALVPAKTQKQANLINRELYFFHQQEHHRLQQKDCEMSYEQMIKNLIQPN